MALTASKSRACRRNQRAGQSISRGRAPHLAHRHQYFGDPAPPLAEAARGTRHSAKRELASGAHLATSAVRSTQPLPAPPGGQHQSAGGPSGQGRIFHLDTAVRPYPSMRSEGTYPRVPEGVVSCASAPRTPSGRACLHLAGCGLRRGHLAVRIGWRPVATLGYALRALRFLGLPRRVAAQCAQRAATGSRPALTRPTLVKKKI